MNENLQTKGMLADPGQHFVGRYEVEFKISVPNLEPIRQRLSELNAVPFTLGNSETDVFYDTPDKRLTKNGQSHVLREMRPSGRVLWISKGPAKDECIAMDLSDFTKAASMLESLGFEEQMRLSKKRDIFFLEDCHVTLDEVDDLGCFVEVAAMTDEQDALPKIRNYLMTEIDRLRLSLANRVHRSYREMLKQP